MKFGHREVEWEIPRQVCSVKADLSVGCLSIRGREQGENDLEGMKNVNTVTIPTNICGPKGISRDCSTRLGMLSSVCEERSMEGRGENHKGDCQKGKYEVGAKVLLPL